MMITILNKFKKDNKTRLPWSYWARGSSLEEVMVLAQRVNTLLPDDPDVTEFADLVT